jgi:hypothetical protein
MNVPPRLKIFIACAAATSFTAGSPAATAPQPAADAPPPVADSPARWDAALFIPPSIINTILGNFTGCSLSLDRLPNLRLTLRKATTKFDYGKVSVNLTFGAGLSDADIAQLDATGTLTFVGFDRGSDGRNPRARFSVTIDSLNPSAKFAGKTLNAGDLVAQLARTGTKEFLSEYLTFSIPVPLDLAGQTGFDDDLLFNAPAGKVLLHVTVPSGKVAKKLAGMKPVFVPGGLWLCADFQHKLLSPVSENTVMPAQQWRTYQQAATGNARLLVRGSFLANAINELRDLRISQRTATITGVEHKGNLVEGDATVWIKNDKTNGGHLSITPSAHWTPKGLIVDCDYVADAHVDLGFNFKLPIGNFGSSVGCKGVSKSETPVEATFISVLVSRPAASPASGASALILKPVFLKDNKAETLQAHVETDGSFKTKLPFHAWMKTDVPKVQVDAIQPVPPDVLPRFPLLTTEPHRIDFPSSHASRKGVTLSGPKDGFPTHAVIEPINGDANADGYWVDFKLNLFTLSPTDVSARKDLLGLALIENAKPKLEMGNIKVTVAGIGPNNDIIKALMVIGKAIGDAYAEASKTEKNVEATVAKANRDAERELTRAATNSKKELKIAERNVGREVGRGGTNTEKTVGKAATDFGKAASKAVEDIKNFSRKPFG